jgi:WD40 repeat protein
MAEIKRSFAVIIGINQYIDGIPELKTAVNDAQEIAAVLENKYQYKVLTLLDMDATGAKLSNLFADFEQQKLPLVDGTYIQIAESDRVLFYFAGHGIALDALDHPDGPAGFIVPQDARMESDRTLLSMTRMHDALFKLQCRHLLVILDCCFAGAFRWAGSRDAVRVKQVYQERYERYISSCAQQVITSAGDDERAADSLYRFGHRSGDEGNSPFAEYLIKGLNGEADISDDGVITATELYVYLQSELGKINIRQTPGFCQLQRHDKGEYIFAVPDFDPSNLAKAPILVENINPYRGLESFEEKDSALFFGRKLLIEKLHDFVIEQPLTVVLGASGSGKSSIVKAGLIPYLRKSDEEWRILAPIRPGESPFTALNNTLIKEDLPFFAKPQVAFEEELQSLGHSIGEWIKLHPNAKLLLVIDQFDELITLCDDNEEREKFLRGLAISIAAFPEQVRIVLTLRSDFEPQFRDTPLERYWNDARFILPTMKREELRQAIVEPASLRVMYFEPLSLIDRLIDEVSQMPGALPLLSFTLSELYLKYIKSAREGKRNNRAIAQEDYEELGGVTRSLAQRADQEYQDLVNIDPAYAKTVKHVMLRMVALGGGDLARRRVLLSELEYLEPENTRVKLVIEQFSAARLLVSGQDTEGNLYIEPAHDALVRGWQKLLIWKQQYQENLILQRRLTPAAIDWKKQKKSRYLWYFDPYLDILQQILKSHDNWFNKIEAEFVQRSLRQKQRNTRSLWGAAGLAFLLLSSFTFIIFVQLKLSELGVKEARADKILAVKPLDGLLLTIEATGETQSILKPFLKPAAYPIQSTLNKAIAESRERNFFNAGEPSALAISRDGKYIVAANYDSKVTIWNFKGKIIAEFQVKDVVQSIIFSPNGQTILTTTNNVIQLWDIQGNLIRSYPLSKDGVSAVAFSPDSNQIVTVSNSNPAKVQMWDLKGKIISNFPVSKSSVNAVAFSPDGQIIVTGNNGNPGQVQLWNIQGKLIRSFPILKGSVNTLAFSPQGNAIVTGSNGKSAKIELWNLQGKLIQNIPVTSEQQGVNSVAFSLDGQKIINVNRGEEGSQTVVLQIFDLKGNLLEQPLLYPGFFAAVSADGQSALTSGEGNKGLVELWDLQSNAISIFSGHTDAVKSVAITPDGKTIVSGSEDKTVRLWDFQGKPIGQPLRHQAAVKSVVITPDGQTIISGSEDKTVRLWDLKGKPIGQPFKHHAPVKIVAISPDGKTIASFSQDNLNSTIQFWNLQGKPIGKAFRPSNGISAIAFYNNQTIAVGGNGNIGSVQLWDLQGRVFTNPFQSQGNVTIGNISALTVSPDQRTIVSTSSNGVRLWDSLGNQIGEPFEYPANPLSVAITRDGEYIVTGDNDSKVRLWDRQGNLIGKQAFEGHKDIVSSVAISSDGQYIVSGSSDGTLRLWRAGNWQNWLKIGCDRLRYHPIFNNPDNFKQNKVKKGARETCQNYVWKFF